MSTHSPHSLLSGLAAGVPCAGGRALSNPGPERWASTPPLSCPFDTKVRGPRQSRQGAVLTPEPTCLGCPYRGQIRKAARHGARCLPTGVRSTGSSQAARAPRSHLFPAGQVA